VEPPPDGGHGGTDRTSCRLDEAASKKRGHYQTRKQPRQLKSPRGAFTFSAVSLQITLVVHHQATVSAVFLLNG